jgi:trimethylamine:corrinoid methyltransferase-like protein
MLGNDFNRFLGHSAVGSAYSGPDNLHDMAKLPDCQSAAEKAAILMAGAGLGARWFTGAGMLSLDEIFSPEQLLVDCEIRDWVQRAVHGVELGEAAVPDWVEEIRAGLSGGFMNRDSSLDHYREQAWYPKWFQRGAIGPWNEKGQPRLSDALRIEVKRRIAAHRYELDGERRAAIETIYRAAQHTILG